MEWIGATAIPTKQLKRHRASAASTRWNSCCSRTDCQERWNKTTTLCLATWLGIKENRKGKNAEHFSLFCFYSSTICRNTIIAFLQKLSYRNANIVGGTYGLCYLFLQLLHSIKTVRNRWLFCNLCILFFHQKPKTLYVKHVFLLFTTIYISHYQKIANFASILKTIQ